MNYGQDTEELLRRITNIQNCELHVSNLEIHSLPELPKDLKILECHNTQITSLPVLPDGLLHLYCDNTQITSLPELPDGLLNLYCDNTQITSIPKLPGTLRQLLCDNTQITSLPELPDSLQLLWCSNTQITTLPELPDTLQSIACEKNPLLLERKEGESIQDYNLRWREWREEKASRERSQERCKEIKESLIAELWHPRRVEKLLELGGFEMLENR